MPLYKRKLFHLAAKPEDLKPEEAVFLIRFTKEIFRDYSEYLNRINLYRQRVWTCKVTGKTNLTYEEALVSEKRATEKIQQFPEELVAPVLHEVQFSMLPVRDLVSKVATKLLDHLTEGDELYGKRNNRVYPCKIVKVLEEEAQTETTQYEVAWLDKDNKITGSSVVIEEDLVRKKLPFSRDVLKSFIRESTYRSVPWVLHVNLARQHGIPTDLPNDLKSKFVYQDGHLVANKKRSRNEECQQDNEEGSKAGLRRCRRKKMENKPTEEPIKYPIDDLLVQPAADDPVFAERPSLSREFNVPIDCVGDLLMIWDFCCSFGRLLHLFPFSVEDFENALCHKDSNSVLVVESYSSLLRLLIKNEGEYYVLIQKKKMKSKITLIKWTEYLCEFLEQISVAEFCSHIRTIRRGHYGLLDIHVKLGMLRELVGQALNTTLFREKLDEYIEQRRALGAMKRGEALEAAKKKREDKEHLKVEINGKETPERLNVMSPKNSSKSSVNGYVKHQNEDTSDESALSPQKKQRMKNSKQVQTKEMKSGNVEASVGDKEDSLGKKVRKQTKQTGDIIEDAEVMSRKQRKEYLEREMEKRFIRTTPLGKDKDHNRYWFFRRDGRIFVENSDSTLWGYYNTKAELDAFIASLNPKGVRERALKKQLEKYYDRICLGLQKRSKEVARNMALEDADVRRSTRVRAPPRENPALAFRNYINKWKEG